jgi:hypothetical protein
MIGNYLVLMPAAVVAFGSSTTTTGGAALVDTDIAILVPTN